MLIAEDLVNSIAIAATKLADFTEALDDDFIEDGIARLIEIDRGIWEIAEELGITP